MSEDFGHRIQVDRIRDGDRLDLAAGADERAAIAGRLGLVSLDCLKAHASFNRDGLEIRACGRIQASLQQPCVATGEPVREHIDEPFELLFVPEPRPDRAESEIELSEEECDTILYDGSAIDFGTAVADTLALAMNPYPRCAEADAILKEAGVLSESEAGPFAALGRLRKDSE